jgi:hypothetical protein
MTKMKRWISKKTEEVKGLSLIEVTILTGVCSVMMLGVLQISKISSRSGKLATELSDFIELKQYIIARLRNLSTPEDCAKILNPNKVGSASTMVSTMVEPRTYIKTTQPISRQSTNPVTGNVIYQPAPPPPETPLTLYTDTNSTDTNTGRVRLNSSGSLVGASIYQLVLKVTDYDCDMHVEKSCEGELSLKLYRQADYRGSLTTKSEVLGKIRFFLIVNE